MHAFFVVSIVAFTSGTRRYARGIAHFSLLPYTWTAHSTFLVAALGEEPAASRSPMALHLRSLLADELPEPAAAMPDLSFLARLAP